MTEGVFEMLSRHRPQYKIGMFSGEYKDSRELFHQRVVVSRGLRDDMLEVRLFEIVIGYLIARRRLKSASAWVFLP